MIGCTFRPHLIAALPVALMLVVTGPADAETTSAPPRLVVQITVDALRGDLPERFAAGYGEGGWRRLLAEGLHYTNAHYRHANTETIVGHTSLATGAYPADHGMVANVWLDRASGELTYNIEDPAHTLLTEGAGVDSKTEIDPTQRTARSEGRSPARIRVSSGRDGARTRVSRSRSVNNPTTWESRVTTREPRSRPTIRSTASCTDAPSSRVATASQTSFSILHVIRGSSSNPPARVPRCPKEKTLARRMLHRNKDWPLTPTPTVNNHQVFRRRPNNCVAGHAS